MSQYEEGRVTSRKNRGPELAFRATLPKDMRVLLGIVPGYADHAARYAHVMDLFMEGGIGSVAIDLRGHGRSDGLRGYCERFSEYLDDVGELMALLEERAKGKPIFLFGHSFGGLVVTRAIQGGLSGLRGAVLSSPYFDLALKVPRAKIAAGKVASRIMPRLALPSGLSGRDVTHDEKRARLYDDDPLVFKTVRARWFTEIQKAQSEALANASTLAGPLYLFCGTDDPIADVGAMRRFFERTRCEPRTFQAHPGLFHETWNEIQWKEVMKEVRSFVLSLA